MSIYKQIEAERKFQEPKWGAKFDGKNTANDWTAYICHYAGKASFSPTFEEWRLQMVKVAALAVAAIESFDRNGELPPRHYDK